ncbi:hypothetical protein Droror1_Dr00027688 [Drosera rotundifolia]
MGLAFGLLCSAWSAGGLLMTAGVGGLLSASVKMTAGVGGLLSASLKFGQQFLEVGPAFPSFTSGSAAFFSFWWAGCV